jgi:hypothetical protein
VSAEAATWLGEHFQVAPSQVKPELDKLFLAGINHVFLHGVTYSPADAPWPGWLFYASTDFGPESGFWAAMPTLSAYVARTQAMLQATQPDRDLLVYFPMHDLWQLMARGEGAADRRLLHLTAHDAGRWLHQHPTDLGRVAADLLARGVMFDFVSDRLLARLDAAPGTTILVPGARLMPLPTFQRLRQLAEAGATVLFAGALPRDVPGLGALADRRSQMNAAFVALGAGEPLANKVHAWRLGRGRFLMAPDARTALAAAGVRREPAADLGLSVLRRQAPPSRSGGHLYFLSNLGARPFEGWVPLATPAAAGLVMDALSGEVGLGALRPAAAGVMEMFLALAPGQSLLVRTLPALPAGPLPRWRWPAATGAVVSLPGPWEIRFVRGGPSLPAAVRTAGPVLWSSLADPGLRAFSGTAVYRTEFDLPAAPGNDEGLVLEIAGVYAVATVRLNGQAAGMLWSLPFRLDVRRQLRPGKNTLELEVSSLPANRVAAQARAGVPRVRYHDIDFVDIRYRPFDASGWAPIPSGITGPVVLHRVTYR